LISLCWPIAGGLLLIVYNLYAIVAVAASTIADRVPRVLILHLYDERFAATTVAGEALRSRLLEATDGKIHRRDESGRKGLSRK
jgi:hypothetical protein